MDVHDCIAGENLVHPSHPAEVRATRRVSDQIKALHASLVIEEALSSIDPQRPYADQVIPTSEGLEILDTSTCRMVMWRDEHDTAWIVDLNVATSLERPTAADLRNQKQDWLREWIGNVRVVGPLLYKRTVESQHPGAVEIPGGAVFVTDAPAAILVKIKPPVWCSPAEGRKLAMIAALSVSTTPGWRFSDDRRNTEGEIALTLEKGTEA